VKGTKLTALPSCRQANRNHLLLLVSFELALDSPQVKGCPLSRIELGHQVHPEGLTRPPAGELVERKGYNGKSFFALLSTFLFSLRHRASSWLAL